MLSGAWNEGANAVISVSPFITFTPTGDSTSELSASFAIASDLGDLHAFDELAFDDEFREPLDSGLREKNGIVITLLGTCLYHYLHCEDCVSIEPVKSRSFLRLDALGGWRLGKCAFEVFKLFQVEDDQTSRHRVFPIRAAHRPLLLLNSAA